MSEFGESHAPQPFESLSPTEKAKAIIAVVKGPVTKEQALDFAGINVDELTQDERNTVEAVFAHPDENNTFMAPEMKNEMPFVDWKSVMEHVAKKLWREHYGTELPTK